MLADLALDATRPIQGGPDVLWHPCGVVVVRFSPTDVAAALRAVAERIERSAAAGLNHATTVHRSVRIRVEEELTGTLGEIAWHKANRRAWHAPIDEFHTIPDDPVMNAEVRATQYLEGRLIVRDNDPEDRFYVSVVGDAPLSAARSRDNIPGPIWGTTHADMRIVGSIKGSVARRVGDYRADRGRPAWWVPQTDLHPIAPWTVQGASEAEWRAAGGQWDAAAVVASRTRNMLARVPPLTGGAAFEHVA